MKASRWTLIPLLTTILCLASSCSLLSTKPVYFPPGAHAEVAEKATVKVWVTNKDTGKKELRTVPVHPGYFIVRPRIEERVNAE